MSKDQFDAERVSCCMDGEAGGYLVELSRSEKARDCWCRFHLIRSIIHDPQVTPLSKDFNKRVMHALQNDPTIFAPKALRSRFFVNRQFVKPLAGLAIAATVAAVTVLGFQSFYGSERGQLLLSALRGDATPAVTESVPEGNLVSNQAEMILANDSVGSSELDAYLLGHMEESTGGGNAQGMLPYVRLAGYDNP